MVPTLEFEDAISIGNLLGKSQLDSTQIVDASVVSLAAQDATSEILTGDTSDLTYLAEQVQTAIRIVAI